MITLTARPHVDSPECWCGPQIVPQGYNGALLVATLAHNDLIGAYLGTWAYTRQWDSRWRETA